MELTGKLIQILPVKEGTTRDGKPYKTVEFIVETAEQYPKKALFRIFGTEKVDNLLKYNHEGDDVVVSFDINAREYNGRWYNDINAWKVSKANADNAQPAPQPSAPTPPPAQPQNIAAATQPVGTSHVEDESSLPF